MLFVSVLVRLLVAFLPVSAFAAEIKPRTMECAHEAAPLRRTKTCTELIEGGRVKLGDLLWAYNSRAISHFELGNTQAALKDLNAAVARDSTFAPAYYTRGEIHRRLGVYQKAVDAFDEAMKTVESGGTWFGSENVDGIVTRNVDLRVSILLSRSAALIELERLDAAEADCRAALAIHPDDPRPYTTTWASSIHFAEIMGPPNVSTSRHRPSRGAILIPPASRQFHCRRSMTASRQPTAEIDRSKGDEYQRRGARNRGPFHGRPSDLVLNPYVESPGRPGALPPTSREPTVCPRHG